MSRTKGLLFVCAVLSFLAFSVVLILQSWPQLIPWEKDYHQALKKAQKENKPLVAYLFTDWCTYCQQMERETFSDASLVKKIGKEYVWLKLKMGVGAKRCWMNVEFCGEKMNEVGVGVRLK